MKAAIRTGRPPLSVVASSVKYTIKMTPAQKAKLERLGGAAWMRGQIEKAKVKPTQAEVTERLTAES